MKTKNLGHHRESKFSGALTSVDNFISDMNKRVLTEIFIHRSSKLCSSYENFHREIETVMFKVNVLTQQLSQKFRESLQ